MEKLVGVCQIREKSVLQDPLDKLACIVRVCDVTVANLVQA